jgi:hypothetical protein
MYSRLDRGLHAAGINGQVIFLNEPLCIFPCGNLARFECRRGCKLFGEFEPLFLYIDSDNLSRTVCFSNRTIEQSDGTRFKHDDAVAVLDFLLRTRWTATESGSSSAPSSRVTFSGSL